MSKFVPLNNMFGGKRDSKNLLSSRKTARRLAPGSFTRLSQAIVAENEPKTRYGKRRQAEEQATSIITIRHMHLSDVASVFHLGNALFTSYDLPNLYRTWDQFEPLDAVYNDPDYCFVATVPGQLDKTQEMVIGFCFGYIAEKGPQQRFGCLEWIGVHRDYQRRGVGTRLYDEVRAAMLKDTLLSTLIADTQSDNEPARQFLAKMGLIEECPHVYLSCAIGSATNNVENVRSSSPISTSRRVHKRRRSDRDHTSGRASSAPKDDNSEEDQEEVSSSPPVTTNTPNKEKEKELEQMIAIPAGGISDTLEVHVTFSVKAKNAKKSTSIVVKNMTVDDLYAVYKLGEVVFDKKFANLYRFWEETEVMSLFQSDSDYALVAYHGKELVGFCMGFVIAKSKSAWRYGYIVWLGISPTVQGLGVGTKLVGVFREMMLREHVRMLLIDTQSSNTPALKFFERFGFSHPESHTYLSRTVTAPDREVYSKQHQEMLVNPNYKLI